MPQKPLIQAPPSVPQIKLPEGPKNRPLGQDLLSDFGDLVLGAVGINDPLDPEDVSTATSIGAMSTMGLGGLGRALLSRLRGVRSAPISAVPKLTLDDVKNMRKAELPLTEININKAELPAEFQAVGDERTYNELREMRKRLREPKLTGLEQQLSSRAKYVDDPIRAAREKNAAEGKPSKVKPRNVPAVRGSALDEVPETFDDYLRQDVEYLRENLMPNHTNPTQRFGEDVFDRNPKQQTFAGLDEYGEATNEAGLDFMRDFNEMQHLDEGRLESLENIFQRHDRDNVSKRAVPGNLFELNNAEQSELSFGPGYPLMSVDAKVPFNKANDAAGAFRRAFEHVSKDWPHKQAILQPNDIAKSVHFTKDDVGHFNPLGRSVQIGVAEHGDNIASHEMRHAMDNFLNPNILDNYPAVPNIDNMPPEYWTHPAEVRARASGAIGELMGKAERTGQQHLPGDFLEEFGRGVSTLEGNLNADAKRLIDATNPNSIIMHDMFRGPYQKLFDFMREE